jgi:hypothetical protein
METAEDVMEIINLFKKPEGERDSLERLDGIIISTHLKRKQGMRIGSVPIMRS